MNGTSSADRPRRFARAGRVLLVLLIVLALVEAAARLHLHFILEKSPHQKFRFNSYRVHEHVPGFKEYDAAGDVRMSINDLGFRRRTEASRARPPGVYRIFLMGGSAAHGASSAAPYPVRHVKDGETVDAWLEGMLHEAFPDRRFEVINAAVTGYQVFQHTAYLQSELLGMDPDMVIFLDGHNDHYVNDSAYRYMLDYRYQFWSAHLRDPGITAVWDLACMTLARSSAACRAYVAWRMQRDAQRWRERSDLEGDAGTPEERLALHRVLARDQFLRALETNLYLLRRQEVKALVCLQPELVLRDTAMLSREEHAFLRPDPAVVELYPAVREQLQAVCYAWNVPFLDLNGTFNAERIRGEQLFIDYCHLTPAGGRVAAEAMLPLVRDLVSETMRVDGPAP